MGQHICRDADTCGKGFASHHKLRMVSLFVRELGAR